MCVCVSACVCVCVLACMHDIITHHVNTYHHTCMTHTTRKDSLPSPPYTQVTYSIALKLFSRKTSNPLQLLEWLKQILHNRTQYLKKHESEALQGSSCRISQQMYTMLETVLLLFLRNTNMDAVKIAMSCFKYLCMEAELVSSPTEPSAIPYAPNLWAYKQLDEASKTPQIGRASQQKKIRAILRELVHTPGSALAWEDTYSSWRVTRALLVSFQREEVSQPDIVRFTMKRVNTTFTHMQPFTTTTKGEQRLTEDNLQATLLNWTNMTGFLCSLAGVSTKPSSGLSILLLSGSAPPISMIDSDLPNSPQTLSPFGYQGSFHGKVKRSSSYHGNRPKSVTAFPSHRGNGPSPVIGESIVPTRVSSEGLLEDATHHSRTSQTEAFISELMQLLSCANTAVGMNIRETVKELISYELSPPVYPYLFQCMMTESARVFGEDGHLVISESNTALFDQLVSIVQHVLETKVEGALEHLVLFKIDDVVINLVV